MSKFLLILPLLIVTSISQARPWDDGFTSRKSACPNDPASAACIYEQAGAAANRAELDRTAEIKAANRNRSIAKMVSRLEILGYNSRDFSVTGDYLLSPSTVCEMTGLGYNWAAINCQRRAD